LLDVFGSPRGVRASSAPVAIARALFAGKAKSPLRRVLDEVLRFATALGRRAILEAAFACDEPRRAEWERETAEDLAVLLSVLRARSKGKQKRAISRVLSLAMLRVDRQIPHLASYELVAEGDETRTTDDAPAKIAKALGAGDVWVHHADDGTLHMAVFLHGAPTATLRMGKGVSREVSRPAFVDYVRLTRGSRARVTTHAPELLPTYASALGLSLRPSLTLRSFDDLTAATFARSSLPRGVRAAVVVAMRVRTPAGARRETRAFDVAAEPRAPAAGYVDRVTLRVDLAGSERPVDVFLELPHRIEFQDPAFEAPLRALLDAIGVFSPGARPDDAWSLAPFSHGLWRWLVLLGEEAVLRMRKNGLLAPVRAAHVATEELRMLGTTYVVREVPGEPLLEYALSEDPSFPARLVRPEDHVALRLDLDKLAAAMRRDLGTEPGAAATPSPVLDLGVLSSRRGRVRFFYLASAPPEGWAASVRRACGVGTTPVILLPQGRAAVSEMAHVELDLFEQLGAAPLASVVRRAAKVLGIEEELEPWQLAEEVLYVDTVSQRVWVLGVLVRLLTENSYRFLEYLAKNASRVIPSKEVGAHVSASGYPDVAARRAKAEVERQVEGSLVAAGRDASIAKKLVVVEGRKGFRLGVTARVA
jgi:hypothetical protein